MSIRLILEHAPYGQPKNEMRFEAGELTIGRGDDAGWQIDDPDQYVSRRHCVISEDGGHYRVTDASRGGVFIDGANDPLGAGNSVQLEHDMRLRLGDFVLRVEMEQAQTAPAEEPSEKSGFSFDFAPSSAPPAERTPRPDSLPPIFGFGPSGGALASATTPQKPKVSRPLNDDDPFGLDLKRPEVQPAPDRTRVFSGGSFEASLNAPEPEPEPEPEFAPTPKPAPQAARQAAPTPAQTPVQTRPAPAQLRDAFLRGAGLDPAKLPTVDPEAEMEELGKRFHALVEGLMHLLRSRAQEKQNARVAQTIIGKADVNPLKFLATTEDAMAALIQERGKGYLAPDDAIHGAFRDMTDHQMRTWTALQSALRRMIDHFDPDVIAKEMETTGLLEALLAGGRSAKLWQLYEERYREIAQAAEERFLGEVGAEFRDAYEDNERNRR